MPFDVADEFDVIQEAFANTLPCIIFVQCTLYTRCVTFIVVHMTVMHSGSRKVHKTFLVRINVSVHDFSLGINLV